MEEVRISYKTAKLAHDKGFDYKDDSMILVKSTKRGDVYHNLKQVNYTVEDVKSVDRDSVIYYLAPTQSLLQKWLREEHKIHIQVNYLSLIKKYNTMILKTGIKGVHKKNFDTYEESLEEGLFKALDEIT